MNIPDRPISSHLRRLRALVRWVRIQRLRLACPGDLETGRDVVVGKRAAILSPHYFRMSDRVRIGQDFLCEADVEIGPDVLLSSRVSVIGNDHCLDDPSCSVFDSDRRPTAKVYLEGDNLIGNGTIILGDVRIGHGTVVGAGSLVTRDLPANSICVGRPATVVRSRR